MIHFHGLPMTPLPAMLEALRRRHAMVSYEDHRQIREAAAICQSVVLDNGAFSAWKARRPHDFAGYQDWASHWLKHSAVEWCVIPDVIDGSEADNDALLDRWGLPAARSVPVYHMHESLERLERLVSSYPRVALGSSGEYADPGSPAWWGRMSQVMAVACDAEGMPRTKLHGLRMLATTIFSHLPLSSADSCNVARNIGIDRKWDGRYAPQSKGARALVMMNNIEEHASAHRWNGEGAGVQPNLDLLG